MSFRYLKKIILFILFICSFYSLAKVECRTPENPGTEAGTVESQCNLATTASAGGAVDREVNVSRVLGVIMGADGKPTLPSYTFPSGDGKDTSIKSDSVN